MRDIIMDSGFWDNVGSGGIVYVLPDGTLPGRDMDPEGAPDEGGAEGGPFPPTVGKMEKKNQIQKPNTRKVNVL